MRTWAHEAAAYARLIHELAEAGAVTDEVMARLPDSAYAHEIRERAVALWAEVDQHANPARWLEDAADDSPDDVIDALP